MNDTVPDSNHTAQVNRDNLVRMLRLTHWAIPVLMAFTGVTYILFENSHHRGDPAWPWLTWAGILVLGFIGPGLSWLVMYWAIRSAKAYMGFQDQLSDRVEELSMLNKLATAANQSLDLHHRIAAIMEQTKATMDADAAMIFIQEDGKQGLRLQSHCGISTALAVQDAELLPGQCLCGQAVITRQVLLAGDVSQDARCTSNVCVNEGFRSVACAPLEVKGQLVGLMQVASPHLNHFTPEQSNFLATAAAQVSVSIENARLYEQMRTFNVELEQQVKQRTQELEAARHALARKALQLQRLLSESYQIQEDTQERIAKDMHDGVTQIVIGALYESQAARQAIPGNLEQAEENLARVQRLLADVEDEIRRVIFDLHPPALGILGVVEAIKRSAASYTATFGITLNVYTSGTARRLPKKTETSIYRIIQAALHNVVTHARAEQVNLTFAFGSHRLQVQIQDDGVGFEPQKVFEAPGEHLGLIGMRERAEGIGADLEVISQPGQGTLITIHLPEPVYLDEEPA